MCLFSKSKKEKVFSIFPPSLETDKTIISNFWYFLENFKIETDKFFTNENRALAVGAIYYGSALFFW